MKKLILSIAVIFVFASLLPNIQPEGIGNSFYAYFVYAKNFISQNYFIFILGFIALVIIFVRLLKFEKDYPRHKQYSLASFQIVNVFIIGVFLSYVFLLSLAFVELNLLSITIHINKKLLGVVSDVDTINKTLKKNNYPPQIVASDKGPNKEVVAIATTITGIDNFYGNYILPSIPNFFVLPVKLNSSILLMDNTLIITQLNTNELKKISPTVGHLLVQKYFLQRRIRSYPDISIMSQKEYQVYRQNSFKDSLVKINQEIKKLEKQKTATSLSLVENKNKLLSLQNDVEQSTTAKEAEYKRCLADGSYSLVYCKSLLNGLTDINVEKSQINELSVQISSDESKLKESEDYYQLYTTLAKSVSSLSVNIPHELGLFVPNKSIKIVFNTTTSNRIADYLETLVHEYLHYASYVSSDKQLSDSFFEEGLTEYFARQVIKDDLNVSTNIGYPVYVKIINQMTNRILETDLEDIYFSKDQAGLERILDQVYGENFYKDNRLLFLTLQYASTPKQALQAANQIMKKIGGNPLTEKDLATTSSN